MKTKTTKHTPGPWETKEDIKGVYIRQVKEYRPGRRAIIAIMSEIGGKKLGNTESNAQLIAAAPDQNAALRTVYDKIEIGPGKESALSFIVRLTLDECEMIRAAIAKAEGR